MCVIWFSYNPLSKDFLVGKEVSTYITRKFDCAVERPFFFLSLISYIESYEKE